MNQPIRDRVHAAFEPLADSAERHGETLRGRDQPRSPAYQALNRIRSEEHFRIAAKIREALANLDDQGWAED
jgi:hypothetical protein